MLKCEKCGQTTGWFWVKETVEKQKIYCDTCYSKFLDQYIPIHQGADILKTIKSSEKDAQ